MPARRRGRATKLTPKMQRRICTLIRKGVPRERAARLAGISASTFHAWMARGEGAQSGIHLEFSEAVRRAEDDLVQKAVSTVRDLLDPAVHRNDSVRLNAAKFILSHRFPGDFSSRQEVRNTGPDGGPVEVVAKVDATVRPAFTDEQLAAMTPEQLEAALRATGS